MKKKKDDGPRYGCQKCKKEVKIKDGKLSCCGITETVERAQYVIDYNNEQWKKGLSHMFSGIDMEQGR